MQRHPLLCQYEKFQLDELHPPDIGDRTAARKIVLEVKVVSTENKNIPLHQIYLRQEQNQVLSKKLRWFEPVQL